jgi:hypothetical protein
MSSTASVVAASQDAVVAPDPKADWFFQVVQEVAPKDHRSNLDAARQYFVDIGIQRSILFFVRHHYACIAVPCQFACTSMFSSSG